MKTKLEIQYEQLYAHPFIRRDYLAICGLLRQLSPGKEKELTPSIFLQVLSEQVVVVARLPDNQIVGMATLITHLKLSGTSFWVEDVVVNPQYRGHGIGEGIMRKINTLALQSGSALINLTSGRQRVSARKLYEKLGYVERTDSSLFRLQR